MNNSKRTPGTSKYPPVNCKNAQMMIDECLAPKYLTIDRSIFKKTHTEREALRLVKTKGDPDTYKRTLRIRRNSKLKTA